MFVYRTRRDSTYTLVYDRVCVELSLVELEYRVCYRHRWKDYKWNDFAELTSSIFGVKEIDSVLVKHFPTVCIKDFRISFVFITYIIAIYFSIAVYSFILKEFLFFFFFYSRELSAESKIKEFLIRLFNRLSERNLLRFFF